MGMRQNMSKKHYDTKSDLKCEELKEYELKMKLEEMRREETRQEQIRKEKYNRQSADKRQHEKINERRGENVERYHQGHFRVNTNHGRRDSYEMDRKRFYTQIYQNESFDNVKRGPLFIPTRPIQMKTYEEYQRHRNGERIQMKKPLSLEDENYKKKKLLRELNYAKKVYIDNDINDVNDEEGRMYEAAMALVALSRAFEQNN